MTASHSQPVVYEVVVRGRLGPVVRAALAEHRIETLEACSVIRLRDESDRDLADVVGMFEDAHLPIQQAHRCRT